MDEINETTILEENGVKISNKRAMLGSKTYAMANITSVSMTYRDDKPWILSFFLLLGGFGALGFGVMLTILAERFSFILTCLFPLLGLGAIAFGVFIYINAKPMYFVRVGSASGEANVLQSQNKEQITRIVQAINKAIVSRV
jgi:hypothetical protein